ncbi:MAG: pyridoxamine 5'-phosphate oxidase family protein [Dehalococcoidia bacterium]
MSDPIPDRPNLGAIIPAAANEGEGLLPWAWARERLEASRNYWLSTVNEDGTPHAMPVWGVWLDERFCFSTATQSRKARNFLRAPACVVTTELASEAVIIEGKVTAMADGTVANFLGAYVAKYGPSLDASYAPFWVVRPERVFGFIESEERFATTATRWRFG